MISVGKEEILKRSLVPVFDDPEPELWYDLNPLFFKLNTELEEKYRALQSLPKFLPFSKVKRKLI